jgi:hypothetical protein
MTGITLDETIRGRHVRVTREVTALRPTREWTGRRIWEGTVTDAATRDAATGELRGVCVLTSREHTWLSLGTWEDTMRDGMPCRRWVTEIEFP